MKKLKRSKFDKKIGGICGGLGEYFNLDPNIIRILFLIIFCYTGPLAVFMYIISLFIISNDVNNL